MRRIRGTALTLAWIGALGVALVSWRFLALGLETAFPDMAAHLDERRLAFALHITASPVALALGLFQFLPRLRARRPGLHRWSGRLFALAALVGGVSGLVLALGAWEQRPVAAAGFLALSALWLASAAQGVRLAMAGRVAAHRRWMIRAFALTFAAVTLRLYLPFFLAGGMDYAAASAWVAWLCWVPNLIAAEIFVRRDARPGAPRPAVA